MKTIDTLTSVDWFSNVGQPFPTVDKSADMVSDWDEAVLSCSEPNWENVCTEARNDLTMHLNNVCKSEFQSWNEVINNAKRELAEPWGRMHSKLEAEGLPKVVADCVEWDTIHMVACEHYTKSNPPRFFERLLAIYHNGHFPCGWIGTWPNGRLQVF